MIDLFDKIPFSNPIILSIFIVFFIIAKITDDIGDISAIFSQVVKNSLHMSAGIIIDNNAWIGDRRPIKIY